MRITNNHSLSQSKQQMQATNIQEEQIRMSINLLFVEDISKAQPNLVEKDNPSILKDDFYSRTDPHIFTSIAPVLLD